MTVLKKIHFPIELEAVKLNLLIVTVIWLNIDKMSFRGKYEKKCFSLFLEND